MAITYEIGTYSWLLQSIGDWLNRADLVDLCPTFVHLAEAQFNRELRVRDMHVRAQAISAAEFVPLPIDFLQHYSLALDPEGMSSSEPLQYVGKFEGDRMKAAQMRGSPGFYTIIDNAFELIPAPQANVDLIMVYYARIPRLGEAIPSGPMVSTIRQTNWLIDKSPDLYLASSILQAAPYLNDAARLQTWAAVRAEIIGSMSLENERAMRSSTQLTARAQAL